MVSGALKSSYILSIKIKLLCKQILFLSNRQTYIIIIHSHLEIKIIGKVQNKEPVSQDKYPFTRYNNKLQNLTVTTASQCSNMSEPDESCYCLKPTYIQKSLKLQQVHNSDKILKNATKVPGIIQFEKYLT